MKDLLKCSSLIKVVVILVVIAFMAGQATVTKAGEWNWRTFGGGFHSGQSECQDCPDAWDKILTEDRFKLVMGDEAVRDNETCLVWERYPDETERRDWASSHLHCFTKTVGGRRGWRVPTYEELATLIDVEEATGPKIPSELKELTNQNTGQTYWSSTTTLIDGDADANAWNSVDIDGPVIDLTSSKSNEHYVWCVRGGQGHDAY